MGRNLSTPIRCAVALVASAACASQPALPPVTDSAPRLVQQPAPQSPRDISKPLEGRWTVELTLDPLSMQNPPAAERVTGEIAFGNTAWWGSADRFGRHNVDLRPFFGRTFARPDGVVAFGPADTSMVTEVSGSINGNAVGIDFIPRIDHFGISLSGQFYGDSATGTWRRRGMEGSGRFWLRRRTRDPVTVAAIPVYTRVSPAPATTTTTTTVATTDSAKDTTSKAQRTASARNGAKSGAKVATTKLAAKPAASTSSAAARSGTVVTTSQGAVASMARTATTTRSAAPPAASSPVRELSTASTASTAPAAASADPKAMGTIRVRTFDKASNQYFATKYSLHLPDGRWMYGTLRTGSGGEGWGAAIPRTAGHYELEITDFVCGDRIWFLKEPLRKSIDVKPGQPADVTVEMDLASLPARKSLDNPTGAKCAAGPGSVR